MRHMMKKRMMSIFMAFCLCLCLMPISALAEDTALSEDIVILYTNDVHTYIDGELSYDVIAAVKEDLQKEYKYVLLADAGDHIQGTAYGSMDKGKTVIDLMNAAGYDVATLGNHEFDYTMAGCMNAIEWAEFPYISCNFYREENGIRGENVLDSYMLFDCGDEKIAFIGITTPETFAKSTTSYFQDENGNFIYGIAGGDDGLELQQDVQKAIDRAEENGATKVIALGHLGVDSSSSPWTSEETIAGVSGLDAFIDGHSHTVMESKNVKDKDGNDVLLTQTGEYFDRIGVMVIDSETGEITTDFIECTGNADDGYTLTSDLYSGTELISDTAVAELKEDWLTKIDYQLGQQIGSAEVILDNYDSDGNRLVRSQETNSGDFAADALYYLFDNMGLDVDIAVMNGGGVRNQKITGDISYKTCKNMHPFGNVACLQTVTGQQILDTLEWGARHAGEAENGGFLHVSGVTYKINTSVANTTQANEMDVWVGGPSEYRVYDVMVYNKDTGSWDALDLNAKYNLAGYNYNLRDLGDGFAMLSGAVNVLDYVMEDYMVLANYIQAFENGLVKADNSPLLAKYPGMLIDYSDVNGCGRITLTASDSGEVSEPSTVYVGGIMVTEENAHDVLGDADGEAATVTFDAKTNTLTLKDAVITDGFLYNVDSKAGICSVGDLRIVLEGQNSVTAPDADKLSIGILVAGDLSISGNGGLTVTGGTVDVEATEDINFGSCGIAVNGLLTIREAEVIAVGGRVTVTGERSDENGYVECIAISDGVSINNGILLDDGAVLETVGGEVSVVTDFYDCAISNGANVYNGDVVVYDAILDAAGGKTVSGEVAASYGIITSFASVRVCEIGSMVFATSGSAEAPDQTAANGICIYAGDLAIKAGDVNVTGGKRTDVVGDAHAIFIEGCALDDGSVLGGRMYVECEEVVRGPIHGLVGTTVSATAEEGEAIYAEQGLEIAETLTLTAPAGGKIQQIGTDASVRYTVVDENGDAAKTVTIVPLTYRVTISGLRNEMAADVPAGKSVNEIYCTGDEYGDFSEMLPTEKEGHRFDGFYTDEACTDGNEYSFDTPVNADITVYPKWTEVFAYVGGIAVTADNAADVLGDGTVSYNAETNTLTLKDAVITDGYAYQQDCNAGIYCDGDLHIVLEGTKSSVVAPGGAEMSYGICIFGDLQISGSGLLRISGGDASTGETGRQADSCGLFVSGSLTVEGCGVEAIGGAASGYAACSSGIVVFGDVSIDNACVTAIGGKATGFSTGSIGCYLNNGDLTVSGENSAVILRGGDSVCGDESDCYAYSRGLFLLAGDLTIHAGTVQIAGGNRSGNDGDTLAAYVGQYEIDDNGTPVIKGGKVTINGGTITLEGAPMALYTDGGFELNGDWYRWTDQKDGAWREGAYVYDPEAEITYLHIRAIDDSSDDPGVKPGDVVTITPEPEDGKEIRQVIVKDANGNEIAVTDNGDGTYSYVQPDGEVTVEVIYKDQTTSDIPQTGDNSDLSLWWILLAVSAMGIACICNAKRKAVK